MLTHGSLSWIKRSVILLGLVLSGLWFTYDTRALALQSRESRKLGVERRSGEFTDASASWHSSEPWCPATLERGVFGRIVIPRLGISALIAEGTTPAQLKRAVGHILTTVYPGQLGNCALVGRRNSFLRGLSEVRENDVIRIDTLQGTYTYIVEWSGVVEPRRVGVLNATTASSLTLATSDPLDATGAPTERFVVRANMIEPTAWSGP